jgi:predicted PurR-regulated permease PerM
VSGRDANTPDDRSGPGAAAAGYTPPQIIAMAVTMSLAGGVLLYTLYLISEVLIILYVAGVLAIGFSPIVRWIERRQISSNRRKRMPRWLAILILYLGLIGLIALILALAVPPLVSQAQDLWTKLPEMFDQAQAMLVERGLITHTYTWSEMARTIPSPASMVTNIVGALQGFVGVVAALVTVLVLPYYLLLEADSIRRGFLRFFPIHHRQRAALVTRDVTVKVSAWLGGQLLLGLIIGVTAFIGLWLIGVPYYYVLAIVAGFGEMIPVVGPILAAVPAILVALTVSPQTALFTAAYFGIQQFIENHFLVPKVMSQQVGVSAVTVLVALLIGGKLLGVVGALLAVPSAAIVQLLLNEYIESRDND